MTIQIYYEWDGDRMVPLPRFKHRCDEEFVVGQMYRLVEEEERSHASHNHFFVSIAEAWKNLPEHLGERFANPEALRKWCLIRCGFYTETSVVFGTMQDAKIAALLCAKRWPNVVLRVSGNVLTMYEAESQSVRSMNKQRFQESKQAVLDCVAAMIGVEREKLEKEAEQNQ